MRKLSVIIFAFIILGYHQSYAQQDALFTHYRFNSLYLNPGYAGIKSRPTFSSLYRSQWLGWSATNDIGPSPNTLLVSADMPLVRYQAGAGLVIMSDRLGPLTNLGIQLSLSKHVKVGKGKLGVGLQVNYNSMQFAFDWRPPDGVGSVGSDLAIPQGNNLSNGFMDMSAGLWYEHSDFYVGLSSTRITNQNYQFTVDKELGGQRRHYYLTGGYHIEASYDVIITPMVLVKSSFSNKGTQFELGAIAKLQERYRGGLNFRQGEAISVLLGMDFLDDRSLTLGYSIDFTIVGNAAKSLTSHELMITKKLPTPKVKLKPPIRTPRYNF